MKIILSILIGILLIGEKVLGGEGGYQPPEFYFSNPQYIEGNTSLKAGFNVRIYPDPILLGAVMSATKIEWDVRKPGVYAINGIVLLVVTNKHTQISFEGVENTRNDYNIKIPTYYGFSEIGYLPQEPNKEIIIGEEAIEEITNKFNFNWIPAEELNNITLTIQPPQHTLITKTYFLWNKIKIDMHTPPGIYQDPNGFLITITLLE